MDGRGAESWFDGALVGDDLPAREFGPLTIEDTVAWAGVQENPWRLHFDRDHVKEKYGLHTFIASGQYRQALLVRWLTDLAGPARSLRTLALRQRRPTYEGDLIRFTGRIDDVADGARGHEHVCDVEGHNQSGEQILTARATLVVGRPPTESP